MAESAGGERSARDATKNATKKQKKRLTPRKKRYRAMVLHPLSGTRILLEERTQMVLEAAKLRFQDLREKVRLGQITEERFDALVHLLREGRLPAESTIPTLKEAWDGYVSTLTKPSSLEKASSLWRRHFEPLGPELVTRFDDGRLRELVAGWQKANLSPKMIAHSLWAFLSAAIRHMYRAGRIERLPWRSFKPPRAVVKTRPAAATQVDELAAIVAAARVWDAREERAGRLGDYARRVIVLCLCGLRNGEGAGLGWDHVDLAKGTITVVVQALDQWRKHYPDKTRPDFPTKNAKGRPLVQRLHPDALEALREQRAALEARGWYRPDGPVFPATERYTDRVASRSSRGGTRRVWSVRAVWRKNANCLYPEDVKALATEAGVPNAARWVTHSLRHTNATLELASGARPRDVQTRIGHASIRQLEQYVHDGALAESAIPALPALAAAGNELAGKPPKRERPP